MGKVIITIAFLALIFAIIWLFVEGEMLKEEIKSIRLKLARLEGINRVRELRAMQDEAERKTKP